MSSSFSSLPAREIYNAASAVLDSYSHDFVGDDTERVIVRNILVGVTELSHAALAVYGSEATVQVTARDFRHFSSTFFKQAEKARNNGFEVWGKL